MQCTSCQKNKAIIPCRVCGETKFCKNCSIFWKYQTKIISKYSHKLGDNPKDKDLFNLPICKGCRKNELNMNLFRIIIMIPFATLLLIYSLFNIAILILIGFSIISVFIISLSIQSIKLRNDINNLENKNINFKDLKKYEQTVQNILRKTK